MTTTLVVGTADLRHALTAVRVHASTDREDPQFNRVRLTFDSENVAVTASDRFTAGLALASIWDGAESDIPDALVVELAPEDVVSILRIFRAGKESGDEPDYMLRFEIDKDEITVTDVSGFGIAGHALTMPRLSTEPGLASVPWLIQRQQQGAAAMLASGIAVSGEFLARFKVAGKTYAEPIALEARAEGRVLLVRCGESFLGVLSPRRMDEDYLVKAKGWSESWDRRLPDIVAASRIGKSTAAESAVDLDEATASSGDGADDQ